MKKFLGHDWSELKGLSFKNWLKVAYGMIGSTIIGIIMVSCFLYILLSLISYFSNKGG